MCNSQQSLRICLYTILKAGGSGPSFDQPLKSVVAQLGETATFECVVSGEPQPNIEW